MADDDDRVRIAADIVLQPQRAFEVEIVGRLVEQKQVRLGKQHGGQRHAHAPAAGEATRPDATARPRRSRGRPGCWPRALRPNGRRYRQAASGCRRCGADRWRSPASASSAVALLVGVEHDLDQRLLGAGRFLRHLADAGILRDRDRAAFGLHVAGHDLEQRRFAGTVLADEAGLDAGRQRNAGMVDEKASGDAGGKIVDRDHGGVLAELTPRRQGFAALR